MTSAVSSPADLPNIPTTVRVLILISIILGFFFAKFLWAANFPPTRPDFYLLLNQWFQYIGRRIPNIKRKPFCEEEHNDIALEDVPVRTGNAAAESAMSSAVSPMAFSPAHFTSRFDSPGLDTFQTPRMRRGRASGLKIDTNVAGGRAVRGLGIFTPGVVAEEKAELFDLESGHGMSINNGYESEEEPVPKGTGGVFATPMTDKGEGSPELAFVKQGNVANIAVEKRPDLLTGIARGVEWIAEWIVRMCDREVAGGPEDALLVLFPEEIAREVEE